MTLTSSPTDGGEITANPTKDNYANGETVTLIAKPANHYKFNNWNGDCSGNDTTVNVILDADKSCNANFSQILNDNSIGKAIVIAASGAHRANTLFPYTDELAKKMYHTLKQRGFTDKNIIYFNPDFFQDIDGDGKDDKVVDFKLQNPATELKQAFAQTASLHKDQQFLLYIHGHAKEEQLRISREYWLESGANHDFNGDGVHLQSLLANLAPTVQQVIIVDTCYSGSILDELAAPNRIIMTSSDAKTPSWNNSLIFLKP